MTRELIFAHDAAAMAGCACRTHCTDRRSNKIDLGRLGVQPR